MRKSKEPSPPKANPELMSAAKDQELTVTSGGPRKFRNRVLWIFAALLLPLAGLVWFAAVHQSDLKRPILEGKPVEYWLRMMNQSGNWEIIRDRLVSLGPAVIPPLIAALEDHPSDARVRMHEFFMPRSRAI